MLPSLARLPRRVSANPSDEALRKASAAENSDTVMQLLKSGAPYDGSLLVDLAGRGRIAVVEEMLARHPNVDVTDGDGYTALMTASMQGYPAVVEMLLENGANVDVRDNGGDTALHKASFKGRVQVVELLIAGRANLDLQDKGGATALINASRFGHLEIVRLLLDNKASVDIVDKHGMSAIDYADTDAIKKLLGTPAASAPVEST